MSTYQPAIFVQFSISTSIQTDAPFLCWKNNSQTFLFYRTSLTIVLCVCVCVCGERKVVKLKILVLSVFRPTILQGRWFWDRKLWKGMLCFSNTYTCRKAKGFSFSTPCIVNDSIANIINVKRWFLEICKSGDDGTHTQFLTLSLAFSMLALHSLKRWSLSRQNVRTFDFSKVEMR